MKTIVYIDGFNLYYGLLRGTRNMWLDLERFAQRRGGEGHKPRPLADCRPR